MEKMLSASRIWSSRAPRVRALLMSVLATLTFSGTALSQQAPVTGVVTSAAGVPLQGVRVRVQGTELRAFTNANGRYTIAAPPDAVLSFTAVGQKTIETPVGCRRGIDDSMVVLAFLVVVVVTAYT